MFASSGSTLTFHRTLASTPSWALSGWGTTFGRHVVRTGPTPMIVVSSNYAVVAFGELLWVEGEACGDGGEVHPRHSPQSQPCDVTGAPDRLPAIMGVRGGGLRARVGRALAVTLSLTAAGCFSASYVPVEARPWSGYAGIGTKVMSDDDAQARVVRQRLALIDGEKGTAVVFVEIASIEPEARVVDARVAPVDREPCTFGFAAARVGGQPNGTPVPVRAGSELRIDFRLAQVISGNRGPSRLDLLVETTGWRRCLAVALTSEEPEAAWRSHGLLFAAGVGLDGHTARVDGLTNVAHFPVALGTWVGPFRAMVGTGLRFPNCSRAACPPKTNDEGERIVLRSGVGVPLTLGLDAFAPHRDLYGAGLGLRYSVVGTRIRTYEGPELKTFHSLSLVPRVMISAPDPIGPGVPGGVRFGGLEFEVPVGVVAPLDDPGRPALSIGMSLLTTGSL